MRFVADKFDTIVTSVAWLSAILRVVQFLLFSQNKAWTRLTLGALMLMLGVVAVTSGVRI